MIWFLILFTLSLYIGIRNNNIMSELYLNSVDKRISGLVSDLYSVIGKPVSFNQSPTLQAKIVAFSEESMYIDGMRVVPMCIVEVCASEYGLSPHAVGDRFKADLVATHNAYFF
jgi:hypothetical protein